MDDEADGKVVKRRGKKSNRASDTNVKNVQESPTKRDKSDTLDQNEHTGETRSTLGQGKPPPLSQAREHQAQQGGNPVRGHPIQFRFWSIMKHCATRLKLNDSSGRYNVNVPILVLVFLAVLTRTWIISEPRYTVFDEVHVGKFASLYLQGKHFFDVHPPLGKLIFAFAGYLSGYDGGFLFEQINLLYPATVPYIALRAVSAVAGVLLVPCVYLIMRELGFSYLASNLAALFVVFDNALVIQSRVIMLDSLTILMTYSTFLLYLKFCNCERMWSTRWNVYLALTAVSLGTLLGIKYTGILGMGFLGIVVLVDLYQLMEDKNISLLSHLQGFFVRGIALVGIPLAMNVALFYLHFSMLTKAGIHSGWLSPEMKATMDGTQAQIAHDPNSTMLRYGSTLTLQHSGTGCWLHSHDLLYPLKYEDGRGSSHQQHVTCYDFRDRNNQWIVRKPGSPSSPAVALDRGAVRHGDVVELVHPATQKLLNSHDVAAPLTPQNQEVAGYVNYSAKFVPHLQWKIEVQHDSGGYPIYWLPKKTQVTFRHVHSGQLLTTTGKRLPEWGSKQYEVVTSKTADSLSSLWTLDDLVLPDFQGEMEHGESLTVTAVSDNQNLLDDGAGDEEEEEGEEEGDYDENDDYYNVEGDDDLMEIEEEEEESDSGEQMNAFENEEKEKKSLVSKDEVYLKPPFPSQQKADQGGALVSFWEQYYTIQTQMMGAHGSMSDHSYGSKPLQWMMLKKTLPYWLDATNNCQITLIGNPLVWWAGSVSCVLFPVLLLFYLLRRRRHCFDVPESDFFHFSRSGSLLLTGYLVHFAPFFLISRVLFLHHYLPALPFKYMLLAALLEHFISILYRYPRLTTFAKVYLPMVISASVVLVFLYFSPFVYATTMTPESILKRHWIGTWDFLYHKVVNAQS